MKAAQERDDLMLMRQAGVKNSMRFERKYLLDKGTALLVKQRMSYLLRADENGDEGRYKVSSLYFDDRYNNAFFEKQNGILNREKLRIRYYNDCFDLVHLERKHKHNDMVSKEKVSLTIMQFDMMRRGDYSLLQKENTPLLKKFYVTHLRRGLKPVAFVDYIREAYVHRLGNVRITFDSGLTARLPLAKKSFAMMPAQDVIMEIKYDRYLPQFINDLLSGFQFTQQLAISKFYMARLVLQGK